MTKMTYTAALSYVLTNVADLPADVTEKLTALREQVEKRNATKSDKPTKTQRENEALRVVAVAAVKANADPMTVTEVLKAVPQFEGFSTQKVSALLNAAVKAGELMKVSEKRVTKFVAVA